MVTSVTWSPESRDANEAHFPPLRNFSIISPLPLVSCQEIPSRVFRFLCYAISGQIILIIQLNKHIKDIKLIFIFIMILYNGLRFVLHFLRKNHSIQMKWNYFDWWVNWLNMIFLINSYSLPKQQYYVINILHGYCITLIDG